jgi:hypothetical protein
VEGEARRTLKMLLRQLKVPQTQRSVVDRALVLFVKLLVAVSDLAVLFAVAILELDEAGSDFG